MQSTWEGFGPEVSRKWPAPEPTCTLRDGSTAQNIGIDTEMSRKVAVAVFVIQDALIIMIEVETTIMTLPATMGAVSK